eukprot:353796-Chlamydomonas_euryale.AAC.4
MGVSSRSKAALRSSRRRRWRAVRASHRMRPTCNEACRQYKVYEAAGGGNRRGGPEAMHTVPRIPYPHARMLMAARPDACTHTAPLAGGEPTTSLCAWQLDTCNWICACISSADPACNLCSSS